MTTDLDPMVNPPPKRPRWQPSRRTLIRLAGTLILLALLFFGLRVNPAELWQQLTHANPLYITASVLLVFPFVALKAWRWQLILRDLGLPVPFRVAYRLYAVGLAAGAITPGQAGDAVKAWQLRDYGRTTERGGYDLTNGLVSVALDRLFDIAALLILAAGGVAAIGNFGGALPTILVVTLGVLIGTAFLASARGRALLITRIVTMAQKKIARTTPPDAPPDDIRAAQRVRLLPVGGVTILATLVVLLRIWLLALALDMPLSPPEVVATSSLGTVASLLPISVGGVGTRDATLVFILQNLPHPYSRAQAVGLSTLILALNLVNLLVGGATWLRTRQS